MRHLALLAFVSHGLLACGDDGGGADIDARPTPDSPPPIDAMGPDASGATLPDTLPDILPNEPVDAEVITFNVGLISIVKGAEQRLPHIVSAIEASGADIVCLQEVYSQFTTPLEFATELADVYPYAAWTWEEVNDVGPGVMIVSKIPLYRQRFLRFEANAAATVDRAVIAATAVSDTWYLHVLCTHLHAGLDDPSTTIRRAELDEMATFASQYGYVDGPSVLLGDFNAGPDPDPLDEECPNQEPQCTATCTPADTESIAMMSTTYGWTDPYEPLAFNECTYCKGPAEALALLQMFPCEGSQVIDRCFTRGSNATITAVDRVMDQGVNIDIGNGEFALTLSDHYGVQCSLTPPAP